MKITWKYVIKRLPSYATLSNLLKPIFNALCPVGRFIINTTVHIGLLLNSSCVIIAAVRRPKIVLAIRHLEQNHG